MSKLTDLPNIGKVIAKKLEHIWIHSAEEFLSKNPYEVFDTLLRKEDPTLCRCALASIIGAHYGRKRNLIMKEAVQLYEKTHPDHKRGKC